MTARKNALGSDLARVDAHVIQPHEYDEIPELTDDMVKRGRGRPAGSRKTQMNLRIDDDVIAAFRAQGDGWQTRMNDALRDWASTHGILTR